VWNYHIPLPICYLPPYTFIYLPPYTSSCLSKPLSISWNCIQGVIDALLKGRHMNLITLSLCPPITALKPLWRLNQGSVNPSDTHPTTKISSLETQLPSNKQPASTNEYYRRRQYLLPPTRSAQAGRGTGVEDIPSRYTKWRHYLNYVWLYIIRQSANAQKLFGIKP